LKWHSSLDYLQDPCRILPAALYFDSTRLIGLQLRNSLRSDPAYMRDVTLPCAKNGCRKTSDAAQAQQ